MKNYLDLLRDVLENGELKPSARKGMPDTLEVFGRELRFDLSKGIPVMTTKKLFFKGVVEELLWFIRGSVDVKKLHNNGVKIWDQDAYRFYRHRAGLEGMKDHDDILSYDEWINELENDNVAVGNCGKIYGRQWRKFGGFYDQFRSVLSNMKKNPNSRYHLITAWNPIDFFFYKNAALPACHVMLQFSITNNRLDLMMLQRSADLFLGVPFNIASYGLLLVIIAKHLGLQPGEFVWFGNSVHLYTNHVDAAREQLSREPFELPELCELPELGTLSDIENLTGEDFILRNYQSHPAIKAELKTGL